MRHLFVIAAGACLLLTACPVDEAGMYEDAKFPLNYHPLLPEHGPSNGQIATGVFTGRALEQPIGFSHLLHAGQLKIDCQYCHSEARKSIHGGVPPLQTCMGCHSQIRTENPQIQQIHQAWCGQPKCELKENEFGQPVREASATPLQWNKVHDAPDYVHFNHSRHVKAGVNCTECHGQVQLQGQYELVDQGGVQVRQVDEVMIREGSLQMGWCLNCHATHPSVDANYGEGAPLRRAELKDCWTCHK